MKRHYVRMRAYVIHCKDVFLAPTIRWGDTVKYGILLGLISNALLAGHLDRQELYAVTVSVPHVIETAEAAPHKEVLVEINYDWDTQKTEEEIRKAFPETPGMAVAIAKCESQYDQTGDLFVQSKHVLWYGQERSFGLFQIHEPDWDETAKRLGLDYKNNPYDNIAMARHIYELRGWQPWTCFTQGFYTKHL